MMTNKFGFVHPHTFAFSMLKPSTNNLASTKLCSSVYCKVKYTMIVLLENKLQYSSVE